VITGLLIEQTGSYMSAFLVSAAIVGLGAVGWTLGLPKVEPVPLD
jgi:hypothetical protein